MRHRALSTRYAARPGLRIAAEANERRRLQLKRRGAILFVQRSTAVAAVIAPRQSAVRTGIAGLKLDRRSSNGIAGAAVSAIMVETKGRADATLTAACYRA
jgi:hypothetical protein